jgi:hypothetical protein
MAFVYSAQALVSIVLQFLLLLFLRQDSIKRYFILFLYSLVYLLTSLAEVAVFQNEGKATPLYRQLYWTDEVVLDLLRFVMLIVLTYQAAEGSPIRKGIGKVLMGVLAAGVVLPFLIGFRSLFSQHWFNMTSQYLNFAGVIMNLGLWTALIGSRKRDSQLMAVSAGLGIAVAGAAINYGVRLLLAPGPSVGKELANTFAVITHIAGVAIWCWAFRPTARRQARTAALTSS